MYARGLLRCTAFASVAAAAAAEAVAAAEAAAAAGGGSGHSGAAAKWNGCVRARRGGLKCDSGCRRKIDWITLQADGSGGHLEGAR